MISIGRNTITKLLSEWGLLNILDPEFVKTASFIPVSQLKIISFKDKEHWQLCPKYSIGTKKP